MRFAVLERASFLFGWPSSPTAKPPIRGAWPTLIAILAVTALLSPRVAFADTEETNQTILHVGVQGSTGYILLATPPTGGCAYNALYFDLTTDAGKAYLSTALTAHASNASISRIDYSIASGTCNVTLLEM